MLLKEKKMRNMVDKLAKMDVLAIAVGLYGVKIVAGQLRKIL